MKMRKEIIFIVFVFITMLGLSGCGLYHSPPDDPGNFAPIDEPYPYECNESTKGRIFYNNVTNEPMICKSNYWFSMSDTRIGAFAFINDTAVTTCVEADRWYPVQGIFINNPVEGFYVNVSLPALIYNYSENVTMEIQAHTSLASSSPGTTVTITANVSNVVNEHIANSIFMRNNNEIYSISGNGVTNVNQGDYIQLILKCDRPNVDITVYQFTTSIKRFWE